MNSSTMIRTTVASVASSASRNRLFWKLPIGLPNALRSLVYCSVCSSTSSMAATAMMAIEIRSCGRFCIR